MNQTINQQVEIIIEDKLKRDICYPTIVEVTRVYNDGYVDCKNDDYGELRKVKSITEHTVGDETLLVFANNNYNDKIVI